jgi:sorting nexin-27
LRVLLPDGKSLILNVKRNSDARRVFAMAQDELGLSNDAARYCALYEMVDGTFERKLTDTECPHNIYIQNYSSAASSCIILKKMCFDREMEKILCSRDAVFKRLCFYQAVNDVNSGVINVKEKLYQLKAIQTDEKMDQYLEAVCQLEGYDNVILPKSPFETEADKGLVTITISFNRIELLLQRDGSEKEKRMTVPWKSISSFSTSEEGQVFNLAFSKDNEIEIKVFTGFAAYFVDVFEQLKREHAEIQDDA